MPWLVMRNKKLLLITVLLGMLLLVGKTYAATQQALLPIPTQELPHPAKVDLGQTLYKDKLFSINNEVSCASCHNLKTGGSDAQQTYIKLNKQAGNLNTPTVINSQFNFRQFWDGRAKDLEQVIDLHITDATIFNNSWNEIQKRLNQTEPYSEIFAAIFDDGITPENVRFAIVSYLKSLSNTPVAFDQYLQGDQDAISAQAKQGLQLFKEYGCHSCHQGPNLGGNMFQKLGIYKDYFALKSSTTAEDLGRYNVTGNVEDKYYVKVPSLRNITKTAPYLHDGSVATLEQALRIMGDPQIGQPIPEHEIPLIIEFLKTLENQIE